MRLSLPWRCVDSLGRCEYGVREQPQVPTDPTIHHGHFDNARPVHGGQHWVRTSWMGMEAQAGPTAGLVGSALP